MRGSKSKIKIDKTKLKFKEMIKISRSLKTAHSMVVRVTIILLLSIGLSITETSRKTNSTRSALGKAKKRIII